MKLKQTVRTFGIFALGVTLCVTVTPAHAKSKKKKQAAPTAYPTPAPEAAAPAAQDVEVGQIKERYWTRGDESEVGVVQNRIYTKRHKFEITGFGGLLESDPFLSVKALGGSAGFHLNEYWAVNFVGWKAFSSPSSALIKFQETRAATTLTNNPNSFLGGEVAASVLYGKLSLVGKAIIYYDLHLLGGVGVTNTDTGNDITPFIGIGQQVYLGEAVSLKLDYRLMAYHEDIIETEIPSRIGELVETRLNWTSAVTLGISFLIGGGS